jgi:hypothetical protein
VLALFAPNGLKQAPWDVFDRLLAKKPELDHPSSHFFEQSNQPRETHLSDLGLQHTESMKTA